VFFIMHLFILIVGALWLYQFHQLSITASYKNGIEPYLLFAAAKSLLAAVIILLVEQYKAKGSTSV
jgi:biotin transporter BioY